MAAQQRSILRAHLLIVKTTLTEHSIIQGLCRDMHSEAEQGRLQGGAHHIHLYVVSIGIDGMLVALERLFREVAWRTPVLPKLLSHALCSYT